MASSSAGVVPGLTRKVAPTSAQASTSAGLSTVPAPTRAWGTSAATVRIASRPAGVRSVISREVMPPRTRACASGTARSASLTTITGITGAALMTASTVLVAASDAEGWTGWGDCLD